MARAVVKTALFGHGHLGKYHAQKCASIPECDFVAVVESNEKARERARQLYPDILVTDRAESVWDQVEALIVATPTVSHHRLVREGLERGKHVFCEKPLCQSLVEADELCRLADSSGRVVQVGHSERFHQAWELVADSPVMAAPGGAMTMERVAPFKGRATDVDVVRDLMTHDLDLLLHVLKERPTRIRAQGFKIRTRLWDHVSCSMDLASGRSANIVVGRNHTYERRGVELINGRGHLAIDLLHCEIATALSDEKEVVKSTYSPRDHLMEQQREFYQCILNSSAPRVSVHQGREVVFYVDKVLSALDSGEATG